MKLEILEDLLAMEFKREQFKIIGSHLLSFRRTFCFTSANTERITSSFLLLWPSDFFFLGGGGGGLTIPLARLLED